MHTDRAQLQLEALGDANRRAMVELLASGGPQPVGMLAAQLPIKRPGVSQHLRILKQAGLVTDLADGTRRIYALDREGIIDLRAYLDRVWAPAAAAAREDDERG
ncbi:MULTISPECIES: metalloregulator ArsR/SmtB family transcription factor [Janibacter]|uniref:ArsR/SmtB family transcription factor n=1 Tax=Janibacter TaxID=53457 RepID=UPI002043ACB6|nr:metalloregulator ArsR/SmtB family transcription factor [Janibacter melonis]MCM3556682.1 metalloregulator ArsR/SmtB family transcription factor [Janibacter melonis]